MTDAVQTSFVELYSNAAPVRAIMQHGQGNLAEMDKRDCPMMKSPVVHEGT